MTKVWLLLLVSVLHDLTLTCRGTAPHVLCRVPLTQLHDDLFLPYTFRVSRSYDSISNTCRGIRNSGLPDSASSLDERLHVHMSFRQ